MISRLKWNTAWRGVGDAPVQNNDAIVRDYANLVSEVDGVRAVWAVMNGSTLTVYTLIDEDRDIERQVYEAEARLYGLRPDALIRFEVYWHAEDLEPYVSDLEPILTAA